MIFSYSNYCGESRRTRALFNRSAAAALCSSVISRFVLYGFFPNLKGCSGQSGAGHILTSAELLQQQSRHFARIALIGLVISFIISPVQIHKVF